MSETILSIAGFFTIFCILLLLNRKVVSPFVAIAGIPVVMCVLIGRGAYLNEYITKGIGSISTTGVMFIFSVIFFGIMSETGAFDPFVNAIIKATKGDPVRLIMGVFLVVPPMLPIFKRLKMRNTMLALPLGLAAGIMNAVPWGGPTLRAATALGMDVMDFWIPFIPTQVFGLLAAALVCVFVGRGEKKRLVQEGVLRENAAFNYEEFVPKLTEEQMRMRRPKLIIVNWVLILAVLGTMIASILSPVVAFMIGVALALIINYRDASVQRMLIEEKGKDSILLCSIIFAAGILMGIMGQSGMSAAMANTMVDLIPMSIAKFMAPIIAVLSVPMSILFDPDSYYYGIMPIIAEVADSLGSSGIDIARASIIGQTTLGWPLSPMIGTFFLFTGMCELDIGEWQKFALKYFMLVGVVMTVFACVTGLLPL